MLVTITAGLSNTTHIRTSLSVHDEIGVSGVLLLIPIKKVFHCPLSWTGFLLLAVPTQNACADARFPVWLDSSKKFGGTALSKVVMLVGETGRLPRLTGSHTTLSRGESAW